MIYEIRLKGRQKQGECSIILTMTFFIIILSVFSLNLIPIVYISAVKPMLAGKLQERAYALVVSSLVLFALRTVCLCLLYGCDRFMLKRAENYTAGAGDIFYYFSPKKMISLCTFNLRFGAYKLMVLTIVLIPFTFCAYFCYSLCSKGFSAAVCSIFAVFSLILLCLGLTGYCEISDLLFLVRYRYIKGDYLSFRNLISQSQQDMMKKSTELRKLKASFCGWFLLSVLIIPLPYVWCYYRQTKACFATRQCLSPE